MNRHEKIRVKLDLFRKLGIVIDWNAGGNRPGKVWFVIACGYSERAMTTNEVEWFIKGVEAALNWKDHQ